MERSVVGSDEKDEEASKDEKISDMEPVVYQLVRVEVDGRLVPATDDEVMEVEQLLEGEKSELASANTIKHDGGCHSNVLLLNNPDLEGVTQSENGDESRRLDAKIEIVDEQGSCKRSRVCPSDEKDAKSQMEQYATKRMRKPTKRYIEELSEIETRECTAKPYPYTKNAEQGHSPSKARTRTVCDYDGHTRTVSTRYMSLEGFSLQVPFALRARRGRPRKDFVALMKHHHSILSDMVETSALVPVQVEDNENGSISRETRSIPVLGFVDEVGRKMENDTLNREQEPNLVHRSSDANGNSVNDNVNAQMPSKTGMRRKHHRAWSLCEVRKLVDGVAKYGAGRWSEIRRLAFASYSYRTSVDLKDKWRNLLRASLAQHQSEKGEKSFRKQTSIPIPTPILYQVRELAKLQAQTGIKLSPRKPVDHEGGSVHGEESGFL